MNAPGRSPLRAFARLSGPLAIALISISTVAPAALAAKSASSTRISVAAAGRATGFWTTARMARARPPAVHASRGSDMKADRGAAQPPQRGRPLGVAPLAASSAAAAGLEPGALFEPVADPTAPGYRVNGVVFFQDIFGLGRCSGTSVNAPNLSLVFTAGHCVNSGGRHGRWYRDQWIFVPAYRYGQRPFGAFPAKWLGTTRGWRSEFSENSDVGAAVVGRNARGQRLGAAVGAAGFASGLRPRQAFDVHGYPAEQPFDGETQQLCAGTRFLGRDPESLLFGGPLSLAVTCDVTSGASGGGWTIAGGRLNSLTAYQYPADPTTAFGPYFGKEVARLYHLAGRVR